MTAAWWPEDTGIEQFTIVAEGDIQISSVAGAERPIILRKGQQLTFKSADHLYISALRDEAEKRP